MVYEKNVCEKAWAALRELPYDEYGIKLFEDICNKMDDDLFGMNNYFEFEKVGMDGDKLMVRFKTDGFEPQIYEFRDGCRSYMLDTLCYEDEARYFLKVLGELL